MDTTIRRSHLNSARMTCGLAQRPEYRDLMTAASKLTGERVNRSAHNHSVRGREAVCAGVNYCGSPGCDLVLVVRGYQIRCADIGWVTGRNVLSLDCGGAHVAAIGHKSASKTAKKNAERYPSVHKAACGGLVRIAAGY